MTDMRLVLSAAVAVVALIVVRAVVSRSTSARNLPPGPPPESWFTGNRIPSTHPWRTLEKWTRQFGDIYTLRIRQHVSVCARTGVFGASDHGQAVRQLERPTATDHGRRTDLGQPSHAHPPLRPTLAAVSQGHARGHSKIRSSSCRSGTPYVVASRPTSASRACKQGARRQHELGITDAEGSSMAGSLFGAGSDTTASGLAIFVMAMCKFPAVLRKLQDEIDGVCGGDRCMPTFVDLTPEQTPYLHAVVQETLRWRPISAGGFQHKLTQDVEYRGFLLPKGSSVVAPHWSISLDEKEYPRPTRVPARNDSSRGTRERSRSRVPDNVDDLAFNSAQTPILFPLKRISPSDRPLAKRSCRRKQDHRRTRPPGQSSLAPRHLCTLSTSARATASSAQSESMHCLL
ncbi:hypothetical protein L1887_61961 [Cichorium endivia]|nr:hypothetical protein L1887_61961 [Cichorium endivia]